jgi:hypothetical protein
MGVLNGASNVIFDHCSATWSIDEALSLSGNVTDVTIQWCLIAEPLNDSVHAKGKHGYGSLMRSNGRVTLHHNLWAHCDSRNPRLGDNYGKAPYPTFDVRNNVIYDYGHTCSGLTQGNLRVNYVGNYIRPGPSSKARFPIQVGAPSDMQFFIKDNVVEGNDKLSANNGQFFSAVELKGQRQVNLVKEPFATPAVRTQSAKEAYENVLAVVGASLPARDAVDRRIVEQVRKGAGKIIDSQKEVGGWPELKSTPAPLDTDHDGIPDAWETKYGLNPRDPADAALAKNKNGYTNLEHYLNQTNPAKVVDYRDPKNNVHSLHVAQLGKPKTNNLGSDAKGNPLRLAFKTGHVSNYDETKVKPYVLPDPLVLRNGDPVKDADTWFKKRRPEILQMFQTEIFGRVPDNAPKVKWEVAATEANAMNGTATLKRLVGRMGDADGSRINVSLYVPAKAKQPAPVILNITFGGGGFKPKVVPKGGKGNPVAAEVLKRGWAYATVGYTDIQPDRNNAFKEGVIGLTLKKGQTAPAADEWGAVSAWAWGISRIVDYFETDKDIDVRCVGIQGHSRLGRTVLWAGAQDERIAAVFASCSGEAGAALARRDWGETVDDMAQNYSWQLAGNYQKWVGRWNHMPVDSHMLIACVAPRTLFCNGGTGDQWADPKGMFLGLVGAGPIYRLVGRKDVGATELPPLDKALTAGDLGWLYHTGGHVATTEDWNAFLIMAERQFKERQAKSR